MQTDESISVSVFPNPSNSTFTIRINGLKEAAAIELKIESTDGKIIYRNFTNADNTSRLIWKADEVKSGVYYYLVRVKDKNISGKLVKL